MRKQGFTLIELLVVIAIIALLAAVVMAALTRARSSGDIAAVKSDLMAVRSQAEIYYLNMNRYRSVISAYYAGNCLTNSTMFRETTITGPARDASTLVERQINAAYAAGGSLSKQCRIDAEGTKYLVVIQTGTSQYLCIDNAGSAVTELTALPATGQLTCN